VLATRRHERRREEVVVKRVAIGSSFVLQLCVSLLCVSPATAQTPPAPSEPAAADAPHRAAGPTGVTSPAPTGAAGSSAPAASPAGDALVVEQVNDAAATSATGATPSRAAILRAQILLDRAQFSPGEIDAKWGSNLETALRGFQASRGIAASGKLDEATWTALNADAGPALHEVTITDADVAGPFQNVPDDMMAKAKLDSLGFGSAAEALGERFHSSPKLLEELNPGKPLDRAGQSILAPNVETGVIAKAAKVVVDESDSTVAVVDGAGTTIAQFPATTGSKHDPLPVGEWKVTMVQADPPFHYNPDLFWDANRAHSKATIKPGPNNPVGVVWIDLSKEHYGIHGTPEPSKIGHTESHGCIRLTNWSAKSLSSAVDKDTPVILQK
jgi:lipoprotein-anchoring transpeptidase ErfK/SrfK